MKAAVVRSFDQPPRYEEFAEPAKPDGGEILEVLAAGLHPRVRSAANGSHYESTGELPLIPGFDGVGRTAGGEVLYFVLPDTLIGSMADRVAVDRRRSVALPGGADPVTMAAAMNPAMSSWIALRRRVDFEVGASVLVLGATGSAGGLAVQVAKRLGAGRVVAAGRNRDRLGVLERLGADEAVAFGAGAADQTALAEAAADVDIVLDYLWGSVAELAIPAILRRRSDRGRSLDWVVIGSTAGLDLTVPSEWLRAARIQILGSGQGSVPTSAIVTELLELAVQLADGGYEVDAVPVPLCEVEDAWARPIGSGRRIVFVP